LFVSRNYYSTGSVSVTLTPVGGTAAPGADFPPGSVTLSWADGEAGEKSAEIAIQNDTAPELNESFSVVLSNPTGGAIIGPRSSTAVTIRANDQPLPDSGGGTIGYLSLLLLGLMKLLRSTHRALRSRLAPPSG
jgi:hypothetical protein